MMTRDETDSNIKQIEKVIPENHTHLLLIIDDIPDVWGKYENQVVNVYAYHFWKTVKVDVPNPPVQNGEQKSEEEGNASNNSGDPQPKEQQIIDEESDTHSVSSKEIEIVPKRSEIQTENQDDCYLRFLAMVLETIHQVFFELENQSLKTVFLTDFALLEQENLP